MCLSASLTCWPAEVADLCREDAVHVDRAHNGVDAGGTERLVVFLTEGWGLMHQARAAVRGDVITADDDKGAIGLLVRKVIEQRRVASANQVLPAHALQHLVVTVCLEALRREVNRVIQVGSLTFT